MQSSKALQYIVENIRAIYPVAEARNIAFIILEAVFKKSRAQVLANYEIDYSDNEILDILDHILIRVGNHEPIQYITGTAYFYDQFYLVNHSVLIPRPETEELVSIIIKENQEKQPSILDIGTGSGCIAITLAKLLPNSKVSALDVSEFALETAKKNAKSAGVSIEFILQNILKNNGDLGQFDIIVSNPPYITEREKSDMRENVIAYEPSLALFVPDDDPFIFYKKILLLCNDHLKPLGKLYVEINESFGSEVYKLFDQHGFKEIKITKDLNQKNRFVNGIKMTP